MRQLDRCSPACDQADQKKNQEDEEENFRDAGGSSGDPTESKYSRNNRDDQKD